jgi:hypothetical protein
VSLHTPFNELTGIFRAVFQTRAGDIALSCRLCSKSLHFTSGCVITGMCQVRDHICACAAAREILPVVIPGTVVIDGATTAAEVDHIHRRMVIAVLVIE